MQPPASTLTVGGDEVTIRVTGSQSDGALLALEVRIPPGGGPPALHRHDPFELYRVESGKLAFYVADDGGAVTRSLTGPGGVVAIPGGCEHTVRNESAAESRAFVVFSPGAEFERFVRAAAVSDDVSALAAAHGVEMTRPLEVVR